MKHQLGKGDSPKDRHITGNDTTPSLTPPPFQLAASPDSSEEGSDPGVMVAPAVHNAQPTAPPPEKPNDNPDAEGADVVQLQSEEKEEEPTVKLEPRYQGFAPLGGLPEGVGIAFNAASKACNIVLIGPSGMYTIHTTGDIENGFPEGLCQIGNVTSDAFGGTITTNNGIQTNLLSVAEPDLGAFKAYFDANAGTKEETAALNSLGSYLSSNILEGVFKLAGNPPAKPQGEEGKQDESAERKSGSENMDFDLPDWFAVLEARVKAIDKEYKEKNPEEDDFLPDKLVFHGYPKDSSKPKNWRIEVSEGSSMNWLNVEKEEYLAAEDKGAFAEETYETILRMVAAMNKSQRVSAEEKKGVANPGSPDGLMPVWLRLLLRNLKYELARVKSLKENKDKTDFPDGLKVDYNNGHYYLKVLVEDVQQADIYAELDNPHGEMDKHFFRSGLLTTPLTEGMHKDVKQFVEPVREIAELLRAGEERIPSEGGEAENKTLPAYPSYITMRDGNQNGITTPEAANTFRMVLDYPYMQGRSRSAAVFGAKSTTTYFEWAFFPVPAETSAAASNKGDWASQQQYLQTVGAQLEPTGPGTETFSPDLDWDQEMDMPTSPGYYVVYCKAMPQHPEERKTVQKPSISRYFLNVRPPSELGNEGVSHNRQEIERLQAEQVYGDDTPELRERLAQLEAIENNKIDRHGITSNKIAETQRLIKAATDLQVFLHGRTFDGSKDRNPAYFELAGLKDLSLYEIWGLLQKRYPNRDPEYVLPDYIANLKKQKRDLSAMRGRMERVDHHFADDGEMKNVEVQFVEEATGRSYPLMILAGENSKPDGDAKYEYKIVDVTHPKIKPNVQEGSGDSPEEAIADAFEDFASDNQYGTGEFFFRVPPKGKVLSKKSSLSVSSALQYAAAAAGITALALGTVASGGLLAPATAAAVGAVATGLGIGSAVVSAGLALNNIHDRVDKDTFAWDAELGLDIVDVAGAVVGVGAFAKGLRAGATVAQLGKIVQYMEITETGATAVLVGLKVKEDLALLEDLDLTESEKKALQMQIALEAVQAGVFVAISGASAIGPGLKAHHKAVESRDAGSESFFVRKGWLDKQGQPTDTAPPFLRKQQDPDAPSTKPDAPDSTATKPEGEELAPDVINAKPDSRKETPDSPDSPKTPKVVPNTATPKDKVAGEKPDNTDTPGKDAGTTAKPKTADPGSQPAPTPEEVRASRKAADLEKIKKQEFDIEHFRFKLREARKQLSRERAELETRVEIIEAERWELKKKIMLPRGWYKHGQKKIWKAARAKYWQELQKVRNRLKAIKRDILDLDSRQSDIAQMVDDLAMARSEFILKYPESISTHQDHEFAVRNIIDGHLGASSWVKHPQLVITLPDDRKIVIIPDYLADIGGKLVVIDAKFSEKLLSAKHKSIMSTCTEHQKPTYRAISRGTATAEVFKTGTEGSLSLEVGAQLKLSNEVIFITNGATPGTMDVIPYRNRSAGNPTTGISAEKKSP